MTCPVTAYPFCYYVRMPTKQTKPQQSKKPPRKLVVAIIVTVALATVLFALLTYRAQEAKSNAAAALEADRAAFAQVEADMASTYEAIVAATGKPQKESKENECSRSNLKMVEGRLHCSITYFFAYEHKNTAEASQNADSIMAELVSMEAVDNVKLIDKQDEKQITEINVPSDNGIVCSLYLSYGSADLNEWYLPTLANKSTLYKLKCVKNSAGLVYSQAQ